MSEMIRSFLAIELPDALKFKISEYISALSDCTEKVKWVNSDNLHLTLKFLGNQPEDKINALIPRLIQAGPAVASFRLKTSVVGAFPNARKPRVLWLGAECAPEQNLQLLKNLIENTLEPLGLEKDDKKLKAHLTLGRVKYPEDYSSLWNYIEAHPFKPFSFEVKQFVLIRSILKPDGPKYSVMQIFSLLA